MPSRTEKQRRFIFAKRGRYGTKGKTPKRWLWVWGPEWDRLAEVRVIRPEQHFLIESAESDPGYREHMSDDFEDLAERDTEALDRYDRKVIEGALAECFDYHFLSGVRYDRKNRYYDVWYQDIGGKRRELRLAKTADDWFWVHFYQNLHMQQGSLLTFLPYRWRCDGARGVANLIRDVACRSYRS
jgi:hypothetical protein